MTLGQLVSMSLLSFNSKNFFVEGLRKSRGKLPYLLG